MLRPLHSLVGFVAGAVLAFAITRVVAPARQAGAASTPVDREAARSVSFTYRPATRPPPIARRADPRGAGMQQFQGSLRAHGDALAQAWPGIYEALLARLHELAAGDDEGARLRGCFRRPPPPGLRVALDLDSALDGLRVSAIDPFDAALTDDERTCLATLMAEGFSLPLPADARATTALGARLIVPFFPETRGDVYTDPAPASSFDAGVDAAR